MFKPVYDNDSVNILQDAKICIYNCSSGIGVSLKDLGFCDDADWYYFDATDKITYADFINLYDKIVQFLKDKDIYYSDDASIQSFIGCVTSIQCNIYVSAKIYDTAKRLASTDDGINW